MTIYEQLDTNKTAIDRIRLFEGEYLRQLRDYYRIGLTWTSNAIEGNSLTEMETKNMLALVPPFAPRIHDQYTALSTRGKC